MGRLFQTQGLFFLVCSCHSKLKIEISIRKKNSAESLPSVPTSVVVPVSGAAGGVFYTHLTWAAPDVGSVQNYNIYRSDNGGVFKLIGISTTTSFDDLNSGTSSAATYPSLGDLSTWVTSNDNCGNIQTGQLNTARSGASAFIISNGGFGFGGTNVALIGGLSNGANFLSDMECKTLSCKCSLRSHYFPKKKNKIPKSAYKPQPLPLVRFKLWAMDSILRMGLTLPLTLCQQQC